MSFHPSSQLDEIATSKIIAEILDRASLASQKRCTYCRNLLTASVCKYPERHDGSDHAEVMTLVIEGKNHGA